MQTLTANADSLSLLIRINMDRVVSVMAVLAALMGGAWIGSLLQTVPAAFY